MKKFFMSLAIILSISVSFILHSCTRPNLPPKDDKSFTFIFMTDIHIQPELNAVEGFKKAIEEINRINPDFVINGGDFVMDALGVNFERADTLYKLYLETAQLINAPVYNTMGNHEMFGINKNSGVSKDHPEYGKKMYEKRVGKRYYAFDHKKWRFYILDSAVETDEGKYIGLINEEQFEWLKKDLEKVDKNVPIIISTHIPFITTMTQFLKGSLESNSKALVINNSKEVLELFKNHNLKLTLQGHLHIMEEITILNKMKFVTCGAISGKWWEGPNRGVEEGFLVVNIKNDELSYKYADYGWNATSN